MYDTCGIMSFGLIPAIGGAIGGGLVLVAYYYNGIDDNIVSMSNPDGVFRNWQPFNSKGGYQVGGSFTALGAGILFSLIAGFLIAVSYKEKPDNFYEDGWFLDVQTEE